jgi:hypothetical protein
MAEQSFTISEWCATRKISKSMFYKLRLQGLGPRCHNAGNKLLISPRSRRGMASRARGRCNPGFVIGDNRPGGRVNRGGEKRGARRW